MLAVVWREGLRGHPEVNNRRFSLLCIVKNVVLVNFQVNYIYQGGINQILSPQPSVKGCKRAFFRELSSLI